MFWFLLFLISLASCSPTKDLVKRGLSCDLFPSSSADLPVFHLNVGNMIRQNVFPVDHTPSLQELPLRTWAYSGPGHHITFRAWRSADQQGEYGSGYWANFEIQVTAPLSLFVNFAAQSRRSGSDPGLSQISNRIAEGSGSSLYPRRTTYSVYVGNIHQNVGFTATGNWRMFIRSVY